MSSTPSVPQHLNFITGNKNKLAEVQAILSGVIELRNQNVDLVEIQGTVEEVTKDKARRAAEAVSLIPIALQMWSTALVKMVVADMISRSKDPS
jgi:Tfp pilus assembly protein FimV